MRFIRGIGRAFCFLYIFGLVYIYIAIPLSISKRVLSCARIRLDKIVICKIGFHVLHSGLATLHAVPRCWVPLHPPRARHKEVRCPVMMQLVIRPSILTDRQ